MNNKILSFLFYTVVAIINILELFSVIVLFLVLTDLSEYILEILYPKYEWIQIVMYIGMYFVSMLLTVVYYHKLQKYL